MPFDLKRHCLAITVAHCARKGIAIKPPVCEPPLTEEEIEAARRELFMADLLMGEDMSVEERGQQAADELRSAGTERVPPWDR